MLRSAKNLIGYSIHALDGDIGRVTDLYFDDKAWVIRYLVVDTGNWLSGRKVLISPLAFEPPNWADRSLPVRLSREQVEDSPSIDLEKPVSRQHEGELAEHYGWQPSWTDQGSLAYLAMPRPMPVNFQPSPTVLEYDGTSDGTSEKHDLIRRAKEMDAEDYDPHLRSMDEVIEYNIQARDGGIGHVETFIIDDEGWSVMYLVVDTRNWLPGKKVLVALAWVEAVTWHDHLVEIDLDRETIKNSPEYRPDEPVNREVETVLYDYYGRPAYWR
jgi:uncharacterized protein YrrD